MHRIEAPWSLSGTTYVICIVSWARLTWGSGRVPIMVFVPRISWCVDCVCKCT